MRDEHLRRGLRDLAHVVVTLLEPQPRKPQRRLAATAVLLGQVDLVGLVRGGATMRVKSWVVSEGEGEGGGWGVRVESELYRELVQDLARVAGQRAEERAVTVHHDEAELVVRLEQLLQRLVRG